MSAGRSTTVAPSVNAPRHVWALCLQRLHTLIRSDIQPIRCVDGGSEPRLVSQWPRVKTGGPIQKCGGKSRMREKKTEMDKTPEVKAAAYLSAVSVMCKQRPFRAARHTIALFAMQ